MENLVINRQNAFRAILHFRLGTVELDKSMVFRSRIVIICFVYLMLSEKEGDIYCKILKRSKEGITVLHKTKLAKCSAQQRQDKVNMVGDLEFSFLM